MTAPSPSTPILDSAFVADALGDELRAQCGPPSVFARAVIDSRLAERGDLFFALPGARHDGHAFAAEAVQRGAAGVVLARPPEENKLAADTTRFLVRDPLVALQRLGAAWRAALPRLEVAAVTGSVGKTTTKLMAAAVLRARREVQTTEANYNNAIGVPLCLLELRPETERAVIELGMYTTGEIALLCEWTRPRVGVVLNVQPVHLERAGSLETIAAAKRELVEALPADGHAILHADDSTVQAMADHTAARVWLFGSDEAVHVRGSDVESEGAAGFSFQLRAGAQERRVRVPLPGAHLLPNVLAAATCGLADDIPFDAVVEAIEALDVPLRLRVRALPGDVTLLDDTYNASPSATIAALDLLAEIPGRRIALLGDMLELGALEAELHADVGRHAAGIADELITVGGPAATIAEAARAAGLSTATHYQHKEEALNALRETLRAGDVLLVKGSRALALETIVRSLESAGGEGEDAS